MYYTSHRICKIIRVKDTYPRTLPMLKPPKTTATALERSCNGMDLQMDREPQSI